MVRDLVRRGHEVHVVAGHYSYMNRAYLTDEVEAPGHYKLHRTWSGNERSRTKLARIVSFAAFSFACLAGLLRAGRSDLVFASSPPIFPMLSGLIWARLTGAKFVLEVRDLWPESANALGVIQNRISLRVTQWLAALLYRKSDSIVALTNGVANTIRTKYGSKVPIHIARTAVAGPVQTVNNNERAEIRAALGWTDKCVAIYLGTIGYANDLECVVEAARCLRDHLSLHIVVVGDGVLRGSIEAQSHGLDNFAVLPPVAKSEIASYLVAADIGLCPLRNLPLLDSAVPTKLLDYMAAGLPVVAAGLREMGEIVTSGDAGLLYPPGDAKALAAALLTLANDKHLRLAIGTSAREAIKGEFLLEQRHEGLSDCISRLDGIHRPLTPNSATSPAKNNQDDR